MKYLLEEWALNGGTLTQLADAPLCRSMKDVNSGMLYLILQCQLNKQNDIIIIMLTCHLYFSDVLALQEIHSAFVDIEIQVSTHLGNL